MGPAAFGLLFHLFGINIVKEGDFGRDSSSNATTLLANTTTTILEATSGIVNLGTNATTIEDMNEPDDSIMAVIVTTIPGIPFLLMSVCVMGALGAAIFLEDIKKGMNNSFIKEPKDDDGSNTNSQSDNSETKIKIKSSSATDVKELENSAEEQISVAEPC